MQEMKVQSLGQKDPLEKEMTICSSILAWKIPWTEETGGQFLGSQRVGHDWVIKHAHAALEPIIIGAPHLTALTIGLSNNWRAVPQPSVSFMSAGVEENKILIKPVNGFLKGLQQEEQTSHEEDFDYFPHI